MNENSSLQQQQQCQNVSDILVPLSLVWLSLLKNRFTAEWLTGCSWQSSLPCAGRGGGTSAGAGKEDVQEPSFKVQRIFDRTQRTARQLKIYLDGCIYSFACHCHLQPSKNKKTVQKTCTGTGIFTQPYNCTATVPMHFASLSHAGAKPVYLDGYRKHPRVLKQFEQGGLLADLAHPKKQSRSSPVRTSNQKSFVSITIRPWISDFWSTFESTDCALLRVFHNMKGMPGAGAGQLVCMRVSWTVDHSITGCVHCDSDSDRQRLYCRVVSSIIKRQVKRTLQCNSVFFLFFNYVTSYLYPSVSLPCDCLRFCLFVANCFCWLVSSIDKCAKTCAVLQVP